jgi:hypothetical protein
MPLPFTFQLAEETNREQAGEQTRRETEGKIKGLAPRLGQPADLIEE